MSSRDKILKAIRGAEVPRISMPSTQHATATKTSQTFAQQARVNGANVIHISDQESIEDTVANLFPGHSIASNVSNKHVGVNLTTPIQELSKINVALVSAELGVAENGALLVIAEKMPHPALLFLCEHLVLIISKNNVVDNMHDAYERSSNYLGQYSVFIAGPSKTADIEQSLVIGAHGPMSLTILVVE